MPIVPAGSINLAAIGVPNVYVQVQDPNPLLNGVATDIAAVVGTATYGPVDSPTTIGSLQELLGKFGAPQAETYDMGTQIYTAIQQGANRFICVRVTDGTDVEAEVALLDTLAATGATLTAKYTGVLGNTIGAVLAPGSGSTLAAPTYKLSIFFTGGVPEIFDNIGGTGVTFWNNLVDAVNLGQNNVRGPSQICTATLESYISSVTVDTAGSYATLPTLGTTGSGSGAVLAATMKSVSATPAARGSGYVQADTITITGGTHTISSVFAVATTELNTVAVNAGGSNYLVGDTITLAGGTFSTAVVLTVATLSGSAVATVTVTNRGQYTVNTASFTQSATSGVGSGATFNTATWGVKTVTVTTPGAYTVLPSSPVAQGSTSGIGTGCTLTVLWGLLSVQVTSPGTGFDNTSDLSVTGGGGTGGATGTLNLGSASTPETDSYTLSGGTNGNGEVTDATLIGVDVMPRTGMYALRGTGASIAVLSDQTDPTYWTDQVEFGEFEGMYMIGTMVGNYYNDIDGAVTLLQTAGIASYIFKLMLGDWVYINDPFNSITRLVSPQGFVAGVLAAQLPNNSSLNKVMNGIVGTQKSSINQIYSDADLQALQVGGIDVIAKPIPRSTSFGCRLGVNTSGNVLTNGDDYPRLVNFIAKTIESGMGGFVGLPQTLDVQQEARSTIQTFLQNLVSIGLIGTLDGSSAFKVILDITNNPIDRVALGFMQTDVQVTKFTIIQDLVVNLQLGRSITQVLPPRSI